MGECRKIWKEWGRKCFKTEHREGQKGEKGQSCLEEEKIYKALKERV